jgi:hypothetical protein
MAIEATLDFTGRLYPLANSLGCSPEQVRDRSSDFDLASRAQSVRPRIYNLGLRRAAKVWSSPSRGICRDVTSSASSLPTALVSRRHPGREQAR